jgi:hypothetical protein
MADTATRSTQDTRPDVDHTDGEERDRFAHVVFPKSKLTEALVTGTPVTALCGKTWVPSRDPKKYPVCPTCKEIVERAGLTVPSA